MGEHKRTIEFDEATADALESAAAASGVTVSQFVDGLLLRDHDELAELDRRRAAVENGDDALVPHDEVVRWLETWGTPDFKSWTAR